MANKNPPAHDFAPAWLKVPTYNNFKPSGAPSERGGHTSRRDEHSFSFNRHKKDCDSLASHQTYFNDCRKDRDEFDESHSALNNSHYYGMDNGFNSSSCNNQMLLSRRPHSRHDFRISLSYTKNESSNKHMTNNSGFYVHKGKGKLHDNSVSNNGVNDGRGIGVTSNNFNQEFPSLQGDISEEPTTPPPALNGSVWEKPRNMKIHNSSIGKKIQLVKKPVKSENSESSRKCPASSSTGSLSKSSSSSIPHTVIVTSVAKGCRALTPAAKSSTTTLTKKTLKEGLKLTNKKSSTTPPPSTHSMEILVKHPKAPGNKSDFLKALRNEKKDLEENDGDFNDRSNCTNKEEISQESSTSEDHVNGINISKLSFTDDDKESSILSSSLEAEERLLREMGWKEEVSDDENYAPLTEDELREFRDRQQIIKKNGIRRNLLANLSPLRLAPFHGAPPPTENSSSSSESDSDE